MENYFLLYAFVLGLMQPSCSWCQFVFGIKLHAITDLNDCLGLLELFDPECETYLAKFCLREARDSSGRSYDVNDCPFGRAGRFGPDGALPIIKEIISEHSWPVSTLYPHKVYLMCCSYAWLSISI